MTRSIIIAAVVLLSAGVAYADHGSVWANLTVTCGDEEAYAGCELDGSLLFTWAPAACISDPCWVTAAWCSEETGCTLDPGALWLHLSGGTDCAPHNDDDDPDFPIPFTIGTPFTVPVAYLPGFGDVVVEAEIVSTEGSATLRAGAEPKSGVSCEVVCKDDTVGQTTLPDTCNPDVCQQWCKDTCVGRGGTLTCDFMGEPTVPTVTSWGLVAMTLLVLAVGTVVLKRRRTLAA